MCLCYGSLGRQLPARDLASDVCDDWRDLNEHENIRSFRKLVSPETLGEAPRKAIDVARAITGRKGRPARDLKQRWDKRTDFYPEPVTGHGQGSGKPNLYWAGELIEQALNHFDCTAEEADAARRRLGVH